MVVFISLTLVEISIGILPFHNFNNKYSDIFYSLWKRSLLNRQNMVLYILRMNTEIFIFH